MIIIIITTITTTATKKRSCQTNDKNHASIRQGPEVNSSVCF